jgi:hypothetical protein
MMFIWWSELMEGKTTNLIGHMYTPISLLYNSITIRSIATNTRALENFVKNAIKNHDYEGLELLLSCEQHAYIRGIIAQVLQGRDYKSLSIILKYNKTQGSCSSLVTNPIIFGGNPPSMAYCEAMEWAVKNLNVDAFEQILQIATVNKQDLSQLNIHPDRIIQHRMKLTATLLGASYAETRTKLKQMHVMLNKAKCAAGVLTESEWKHMSEVLRHSELDEFIFSSNCSIPSQGYKWLTEDYVPFDRSSLGKRYDSHDGVVNILLGMTYSTVLSPSKVAQLYSPLLTLNDRCVRELMLSLVLDEDGATKIAFTNKANATCSEHSSLDPWTHEIVVNIGDVMAIAPGLSGGVQAIFVHEANHERMDKLFENGATAHGVIAIHDPYLKALLSKQLSFKDLYTSIRRSLPNIFQDGFDKIVNASTSDTHNARQFYELATSIVAHNDAVVHTFSRLAQQLGQEVTLDPCIDVSDCVDQVYESLPMISIFLLNTLFRMDEKHVERRLPEVVRNIMWVYTQGFGLESCPTGRNITAIKELPMMDVAKGVVRERIPAITTKYKLSNMDIFALERWADYIHRYRGPFSIESGLNQKDANGLMVEYVVRCPELLTIAKLGGLDTTQIDQQCSASMEFWRNHVSPLIHKQINDFVMKTSDKDCYCDIEGNNVGPQHCDVLLYINASRELIGLDNYS